VREVFKQALQVAHRWTNSAKERLVVSQISSGGMDGWNSPRRIHNIL
jgi:hypothetical protein